MEDFVYTGGPYDGKVEALPKGTYQVQVDGFQETFSIYPLTVSLHLTPLRHGMYERVAWSNELLWMGWAPVESK